VRSNRVVAPPPTLDDRSGFYQRVEEFSIEQLITQPRVEARAIRAPTGYASLFNRRTIEK
jgi:hypothetical protein